MQCFKETFGKKRSRIWTNSQGCTWSKELLGEHINKWAKAIAKPSKRKARNILGLFTGHYDLRCYTHKSETQGTSNLCRWCEKEEETPSHFLCKCPILMSHRQKCMDTEILDPEILKEMDINNLLTYCRVIKMMDTSQETAEGIGIQYGENSVSLSLCTLAETQ